jgi:hypothetical protein
VASGVRPEDRDDPPLLKVELTLGAILPPLGSIEITLGEIQFSLG